ncbi:MAG: IPTL-CTERM sorting domain-containing protein [Xanthomonadales bacterium]|nr:IPTL-CTERM sorting domain-containing protein [Xanthomonadales bacterium]
MNMKRAILIFMGALLVPGVALAGDVTPFDGTARFDVSKVWLDGEGTEVVGVTDSVNVTLTCNTGLPLEQDADITSSDGVVFVVTELASVEDIDCTVTESVPSGYSAEYFANFSDSSTTACVFEGGVERVGPDNTCVIENSPDTVEVTVSTVWDLINNGGADISQETDVTITCNAPIDGGDALGEPFVGYYSATDTLVGNDSFTVSVAPAPGGSQCFATDTVNNSAVEGTSTCGSQLSPGMSISVGSGDSCEFTYTVFFEGIPTLSQYGLAVMILLMLGVGFIGVRRFV